MKRFFILALWLFMALSPVARADGPDDEYVVIYGMIQQGDNYNDQGQAASALAKYKEAQAGLKKFDAAYPDWNEKVVHYRLSYLAAKIEQISTQPPPSSTATNAPAAAVAASLPPSAPAPSVPAAASASETTAAIPVPASETNNVPVPPAAPEAQPVPTAQPTNQAGDLQDQLNRVQAERDTLAARLKDALAAATNVITPPAISAEAQKQIDDLQGQVGRLQSERDTLAGRLKDALAASTNAPAAPAVTPEAGDRIKDLQNQVWHLQSERDALVARLNDALNAASNAPAAQAISPEAASQIRNLQEELNQSAAEKDSLAAKLREALAAQPAAVDPRELAKAEDTIQELQKENETLKADLAQARTNTAPAESAAMEQTRQELGAATRRIEELHDANSALVVERDALQQRVKSQVVPDQAGSALQAENDILKKQVADLQSKAGPAAQTNDVDQQLHEARSQIAALESDQEILRLQKSALESRVKRLAAMTDTPPAIAGTPTPAELSAQAKADAKIQQLETQRDELLKSLDVVISDFAGHKKGRETTTRMDEMSQRLAEQSARIETLEAQAVPYSPEELALFKAPAATLLGSAHHSGKGNEMPPGAGPLLNEAQQFFNERQFDQAAGKYLEVLKMDDHNVVILANLAAIQLELNQTDESEKHLLQALIIEPDDAYSLAVLGRLKFQEQKYDEALDALSRAAQLDPQNPEIQNYLGITLSHKGMRGPAESALRKAIQLDPNYGSAHNNLAVVYVTQKPPLLELARWHYQKAMASGHPRNPELEKLLDLPASAPDPQ